MAAELRRVSEAGKNMRKAVILFTLILLSIIVVLVCQILWQHDMIRGLQYGVKRARTALELCAAESVRKDTLIEGAFAEPLASKPMRQLTVTATAYTARAAECDATPWYTASMTLSRIGVIAVSRDLERRGLTLGKTIIIKGMGAFRVEDRMNKRFSNRIDILHANVTAARLFARRDVEILFIGG